MLIQVLLVYLPLAVAPGDDTAKTIRMESIGQSSAAQRVTQAIALSEERAHTQALEVLKNEPSAPDALAKARILRQLNRHEEALEWVSSALGTSPAPPFDLLLNIESALAQIATSEIKAGTGTLLPLIKEGHPAAMLHLETLVRGLVKRGPRVVLQQVPQLLDGRGLSPNTRSYLLHTIAAAYEKTGKHRLRREVELQSFLTAPLGRSSPKTAPEKTNPSPEQLLKRAQIILESHRNEAALRALKLVPQKKLSAAQMCRFLFTEGLAHRKLHHYVPAQKSLMKAARTCTDKSMRRRAAYVGIKVISIRSGLAAIEPIEAFVTEFAGHSMVDDLLFWAGDLYQRRKRLAEAHSYYERIQNLPIAGDHCGEATWRRAWIYYRNGDLEEAQGVLKSSLQQVSCTPKKEDRARATYWLARISLDKAELARAARRFERVLDEAPLSFYAQLALTRLQEMNAPRLAWLEAHLMAPKPSQKETLCASALQSSLWFQHGLSLLSAGYQNDAGHYLSRISAGLGMNRGENCQPVHSDLVVALLLNRAGFKQKAHWLVRSRFANALQKIPTSEEAGIFLAAYPMAFAQEIGASEKEHNLPPLFLQALAREESAFDAEVVSWAGAYGLTQLLLRTAKNAGKMLSPTVAVRQPSELFNAKLNARLGGAFLASLINHFQGSTALALCGYNAAMRTANTWWTRHAGDPFDVFAEELTIKETRKYVKRVHKTWGIYRWLYQGQHPALAIEAIPARKTVAYAPTAPH